jgi:hypothetical protein
MREFQTTGASSHAGGAVDRPSRQGLLRGSGGQTLLERFGPPKKGLPPKLYRIGEVVAHSGVSRQTVHNYTMMGLLHEHKRTVGGHRLYGEDVFIRLEKIAELKAGNQSMTDIRNFFAEVDGA